MKDYKYIFFDVDGTIIDPKEGITKSVQFALEKFNIRINNLKELECFIGPPLLESFKKYYNFDDDNSELALKYYREYFKKEGINKNHLYNGIIEVLKKLKEKEKKLIIATSKPTIFTEKILKDYDIYKYFDFISGATLDNTRTKKEDIIAFAINQLKIENTDECIMIGDRRHDIIGANKNKMDSIGVLYGYGTLTELKSEGTTYIISTVDEILNIIS